MNSLFFLKLDEPGDQSVFNGLLAMLTPEQQEELKKLRFSSDRNLKICSEVLVRCLICKTLRIKNKDIKIEKNCFGKPCLVNRSKFHYNVSHTKNAIVVATSTLPVGVDIEKMKEIDCLSYKSIFTYEEFSFLIADSNLQNKRFFELWTKKEAYIKWLGTGLSTALNSFDVRKPSPLCNILAFQKDDYMIAVCGESNFDEKQIKQIFQDELLELWFRYCV